MDLDDLETECLKHGKLEINCSSFNTNDIDGNRLSVTSISDFGRGSYSFSL